MPTYNYIDGNNNAFVIEPTSIAYVPITKRESSSGSYSGGAPATAAITQAQYAAIVALLEEMIADTPNRIADRTMGCGTIVKADAHAFVNMRSPLKSRLERELRALLGA